jgi:hypothetical protein
MTQSERAECDPAYAEARLAAVVGEHIHAAREGPQWMLPVVVAKSP